MSNKFKIGQPKPLKMTPGVNGMPLALEDLMVNLVELDKDSVVPSHRHHEEQATFVFKGELQFELEGEKFTLGPGEGVLIPSNMNHSARAIKWTLAYDCFSPPRHDYLAKAKQTQEKE